jgi:pimeloyl-ACP methyl ester carboxylesterase
MSVDDWAIEGSRGELIFGTTHEHCGELRGVVLLAHGFKGYKDYGMFPWLSTQFSKEGYTVHRFNFAHSGMSSTDGPFERADLFEQSTWNRQVEDIEILADTFSKPDCPLFLCGHSRGGVSVLLSIGRGKVQADGVITLSSPSACLSMTAEMQQELLHDGRLESPSGRTGQMLYVGKVFLEEQFEEPKQHDLLQLVHQIECPCLVIHGEDDSTVPMNAATTLAENMQHSTVEIILGGDHVFNTPNPFHIDSMPSPQLNEVWIAIESWLNREFK